MKCWLTKNGNDAIYRSDIAPGSYSSCNLLVFSCKGKQQPSRVSWIMIVPSPDHLTLLTSMMTVEQKMGTESTIMDQMQVVKSVATAVQKLLQ